MGVLGKFKDLVIGSDEDEEEDYEEELEVEEAPPVKKAESRNSFMKPKPEGTDLKFNAAPQVQAPRGSMGNAAPLKLIVTEPKGFEDSQRLVDNLKARKPVIINFEKLESGLATKIFNFLLGATYALGGNVQEVTSNILVFVPDNVDISTNIEQKNINFGDMNSSKGPWR